MKHLIFIGNYFISYYCKDKIKQVMAITLNVDNATAGRAAGEPKHPLNGSKVNHAHLRHDLQFS
jgi:hypothetical protein